MGSNATTPQVNHAGIDSTTYIYSSVGQQVPLSDQFLYFKYLTSENSALNTQKTEKIGTKKFRGDGFSVQFSDFVFILIIFLFSLLAYVRFYGKNYYSRILTSIFNYSYSSSFFKEKNLAFALNSNLLLVVFYLCTALLLGVLENNFQLVPALANQWILLFINLAIIVISLLLYKLAFRLCGILFGQYRLVAEYLFYFNNLLKTIGIIYLVLLLGAFFSNEFWKHFFIYVAILVSCLAYFIKISRVILILFRNRFSLYYLILYFCALEIIPVMLLLKIFILVTGNNFAYFKLLV